MVVIGHSARFSSVSFRFVVICEQVAIAKAIASLQKYVTAGEGLKAIKTVRTLVNNALIVSVSVAWPRSLAVVLRIAPCCTRIELLSHMFYI